MDPLVKRQPLSNILIIGIKVKLDELQYSLLNGEMAENFKK
jgi:hypothetical protein